MDQIKTGRLIRVLRQGQNLTQAELGEKLGVSGKAVSKWECGAGAPDIALPPLSLTVHHAADGWQAQEFLRSLQQEMDRFGDFL